MQGTARAMRRGKKELSGSEQSKMQGGGRARDQIGAVLGVEGQSAGNQYYLILRDPQRLNVKHPFIEMDEEIVHVYM